MRCRPPSPLCAAHQTFFPCELLNCHPVSRCPNRSFAHLKMQCHCRTGHGRHGPQDEACSLEWQARAHSAYHSALLLIYKLNDAAAHAALKRKSPSSLTSSPQPSSSSSVPCRSVLSPPPTPHQARAVKGACASTRWMHSPKTSTAWSSRRPRCSAVPLGSIPPCENAVGAVRPAQRALCAPAPGAGQTRCHNLRPLDLHLRFRGGQRGRRLPCTTIPCTHNGHTCSAL